MKGKMNLPLKDFLTLVGPALVLHIIEEEGEEPLFNDKAGKIRDFKDLLNREVKFIEPTADIGNTGRFILRIWIYKGAA